MGRDFLLNARLKWQAASRRRMIQLTATKQKVIRIEASTLLYLERNLRPVWNNEHFQHCSLHYDFYMFR